LSATSERWWVGNEVPPSWRQFEPAQLPIAPTAYLSASAIVLSNVPADALAGLAQDRLEQYVRDPRGSLLLLGGEHAFAARGYPGPALERSSPLARAPPQPAVHWNILIVASGST